MPHSQLDWLPEPPSDFRHLCGAVAADDRAGNNLRRLAGYALDGNKLASLAKARSRLSDPTEPLHSLTPFRLGILSNATTDFCIDPVTASGLRHGLDIAVSTAAFGHVLQAAVDPQSSVNSASPDAVLLALDYRWLPHVVRPGTNHTNVVASAIEELEAISAALRENGGGAVIFQTFAPPPERLFGNLDAVIDGTWHAVLADLNRAIRDMARAGAGDYLLDIEALAAAVGLEDWHAPSLWHHAKLPFSQHLLPLYAEHVARLVAAIRGKSRKCLVLDLDNTIWGGVIGDDGLSGIVLGQGSGAGEAFLAIQRLSLELRERGIVLAVCSKNNHDVAVEPFRKHPDMLLKEEHFASFQANWTDKASNLEVIADALNIGIDSLVLLDDNPVERAQVREALPAVAVPELPSDPALFPRVLTKAGYFETVVFSTEDRQRAAQYQANAGRKKLKAGARDLTAFLESLEMAAIVGPVSPVTRLRVTQLINKSNQFNLTTRRYTERDVENIEQSDEFRTWQFRLVDKFGDNGIICVVICRVNGDVWEIDTWLMSCRVLERRMEQLTLNVIAEDAAANGARRLIGHFLPSGRNDLVREHYQGLGFSLVDEANDGATTWSLDVVDRSIPQVPIEIQRETASV